MTTSPGPDRPGGHRVVEAPPQDTAGTQVSASRLEDGARSIFERNGATYARPKGQNHRVMTTTVAPAGQEL